MQVTQIRIAGDPTYETRYAFIEFTTIEEVFTSLCVLCPSTHAGPSELPACTVTRAAHCYRSSCELGAGEHRAAAGRYECV